MQVSSGVARVELERLLEVGRRRSLHDFDVGHPQLADAFLELFEKPGVADRRQRLRGVRGDERAFPLDLDEQVLADELAERLSQRHPAHRQLA